MNKQNQEYETCCECGEIETTDKLTECKNCFRLFHSTGNCAETHGDCCFPEER